MQYIPAFKGALQIMICEAILAGLCAQKRALQHFAAGCQFRIKMSKIWQNVAFSARFEKVGLNYL